MIEEIESRNDKGDYHGYQQWYDKGMLTLRGTMKNNLEVGYEEFHIAYQTSFFIR
jgi:hypothetical protein